MTCPSSASVTQMYTFHPLRDGAHDWELIEFHQLFPPRLNASFHGSSTRHLPGISIKFTLCEDVCIYKCIYSVYVRTTQPFKSNIFSVFTLIMKRITSDYLRLW